MSADNRKQSALPLIERPLPPPSGLADPREFAWEILRRRADYRETPARVEWLDGMSAPVELIRPDDAPSSWGLRFRRSA